MMSSTQRQGPTDQECPICTCEMVLPTAIPACGHKFCFICLKGVNMSNLGGCPICRGPIDDKIFKKPKQALDLKMDVPEAAAAAAALAQQPSTSTSTAAAGDKKVKQEPVDEDVKPDVAALNAQMRAQAAAAPAPPPPQPRMYWLYHGRHQGWWRFDPRIEKDIEEAFVSLMPVTEVTICGHPYVIDFSKMSQFPKNSRGSAREVKRVNSDEFDAMNVKGLAGVFASRS
ncbi:unnamed protein product [Caenorhabditis brenneri]